MSDERSYIIKPTDPSAIVKLQDPTVIEQLLEQPLTVVAEVTTGLIVSGMASTQGQDADSHKLHLRAESFNSSAKSSRNYGTRAGLKTISRKRGTGTTLGWNC
jgi:hypothetical protein